MSKIKNVVNKIQSKATLAQAYVTAGIVAASTAPVLSYAEGPEALVKKVIEVVVKMFPFIGAFFVVSGVFKLILAYRNDQPEAQAGAAKDIVIGAVFIVFATFIWEPISGALF